MIFGTRLVGAPVASNVRLRGNGEATEAVPRPGTEIRDILRREVDLGDDLNITMRWLSYPGRVNAVAAAAEAAFAGPTNAA